MVRALNIEQEAFVSQLTAIWAPAPEESCSQWAERTLELTARQTDDPGPFSLANREYMREVLDECDDSSVESDALCWGSQLGKTTAFMVIAARKIRHAPTPMIWLMPNVTLVESFSETRWQPFIQDAKDMADEIPTDRHKIKKAEQHFRRCTLNFIGSNSPANLASRPAGLLIADETDKFAEASGKEDAALPLAEQRLKEFNGSKKFLSSTPSVEDGPIWKRYLEGDRRKFFIPCPHCGEKITLEWGRERVKWDPEAKNLDGSWDYERVLATAHYVAQCCGGKINDAQKVAAIRKGRWVATNPAALPGVRSRHLSSLYSASVKATWGYLAVQWLKANDTLDGLQSFINGVLAQPWEERRAEKGEEITPDAGTYKLGDEWPDEVRRFFAVDCQKDHFWGVIRAFAADGRSRLIWCGRLATPVDIRATQEAHKVADADTWLDSGHFTTTVYRECVMYGWTAVKGEDDAVIRTKIGDRIVNGPVGKSMNGGDPFLGLRGAGRHLCDLYLVSRPTTHQMLHSLKVGTFPGWTIAEDAPELYRKQLQVVRREKVNPRTGVQGFEWVVTGSAGNHLNDAERYALAAAMVAGLVKLTTPVSATPPPTTAKPSTPTPPPAAPLPHAARPSPFVPRMAKLGRGGNWASGWRS